MNPEGYVFDQLELRLGRKRLLECVESVVPEDYDLFATGSLLLKLIDTDTVLAVTLSYCWRDVRSLAVVCKRFANAIRKPEFWAQGVRCRLRVLCSTPSMLPLRALITG